MRQGPASTQLPPPLPPNRGRDAFKSPGGLQWKKRTKGNVLQQLFCLAQRSTTLPFPHHHHHHQHELLDSWPISCCADTGTENLALLALLSLTGPDPKEMAYRGGVGEGQGEASDKAATLNLLWQEWIMWPRKQACRNALSQEVKSRKSVMGCGIGGDRERRIEGMVLAPSPALHSLQSFTTNICQGLSQNHPGGPWQISHKLLGQGMGGRRKEPPNR